MDEADLRERVGQLRLDLLARVSEETAFAIEGPLLHRAAQWAQTEDPESLAYLTEIPLPAVNAMAAAFRFTGIWPQTEDAEEA